VGSDKIKGHFGPILVSALKPGGIGIGQVYVEIGVAMSDVPKPVSNDRCEQDPHAQGNTEPAVEISSIVRLAFQWPTIATGQNWLTVRGEIWKSLSVLWELLKLA
jgi:hypothetical protein